MRRGRRVGLGVNKDPSDGETSKLRPALVKAPKAWQPTCLAVSNAFAEIHFENLYNPRILYR